MTPPAELLATVREFAFPRFTGSAGERRAADLVADRFARMALDVRREPFRAGRHAIRAYQRVLFSAGAFLAALTGFAASRSPALGALSALAFGALLARSTRWSPRIEGLFERGPQIESQNVIARRPPRDERPVHIVVLAHLDSKSSRLPTAVTVGSLLVALAVTAFLGLWSFAAWAGLSPAPDARHALPAALAAALPLLAVALLQCSGDASPGAMDNASGLAVLLESARALPADPALSRADLTFVATGAEEIGLVGAMRWVQAHAEEYPRDRTLFVNIDSVGVGSGLLLTGLAGLAPSGFADPISNSLPTRRLVERAARRAGVQARSLPILLGAGVDTMPIAARGYATVTLLGQVLGAASRRMHTPRDTVEALNEPALRDAARLVHAIAREAAGPPA